MPAEIKWQPKTQLYKYNYGVGMNFYQPMVDFIDEKTHGQHVSVPHLPWTEELGLDQFDPTRISSYSEQDLAKVSERTERNAKLRMARGHHASSSFLLSESVSAARITTKIQQETRKKDKLVKEINKLKSRMKDDIEYNPDEDKQIERELRAEQRFLRGKSSGGIAAQLLLSSRKAIEQGLEKEHVSAASAGRVIQLHSKFMDERNTRQLEQAFKQPLDSLSQELRGFDRRTTHILIDQR
ncbi:paramyosin, short form-like [Sitophilus oryzae]|uniref:Paramyosin, short form-like n=1 Tax=Sitophilus oryzae TaxID=7048 RepID=A0A6J2X447_SITOR|nr:paramyosin, short form-like [Sitophilus oryzae]